MTNTSATGGYLSPETTPAPLEDADLGRFLQQVVVGITGLSGTFVRPRWQPGPPAQPKVDTDWCAIGVMSSTPDAGPYIRHDPAGDGSDEVQRHTILEILASFYGPAGMSLAERLRDGLSIPQNGEVMRSVNMALVDVGGVITASDLVNAQFIPRYDTHFRVRRRITRVYPVLNILSLDGEIFTNANTNPFSA